MITQTTEQSQINLLFQEIAYCQDKAKNSDVAGAASWLLEAKRVEDQIEALLGMQEIEWRNKQELFCAKCLRYFDADFDQCPRCTLEITQGCMMSEEEEVQNGELRVSVLEAAVARLTVQIERLTEEQGKPCPHCGKYVEESEVGNE